MNLRVRFLLLAAALLAGLGSRSPAAETLRLEAQPEREYYLHNATNQYLVQVRVGSAPGVADPATPPAPPKKNRAVSSSSFRGSAESAPPAPSSAPPTATAAEIPAAPPPARRNVAFVLDRSGSMAGDPLDAARAGLLAAVQALADDDLVSVVFFGSEVETLVESRRRADLGDWSAALARVEATGGSALYDALNQGAALLRRGAARDVVSRLILLTDGPATKGPRERTDFTKLAEVFAGEGLDVAVLGYGPDFEEDLLSEIARAGGGRFRSFEQPDQLRQALPAALPTDGAVLARDLVLTLECSWRAEEIDAHGALAATIDDQTATWRLPLLQQGDAIAPVVAIRSAGPTWFNGLKGQLAEVRLRWTDPRDGAPREAKTAVEVRFDGDPRISRESRSAAVNRHVVEAVFAEGLADAIEQLDKGDARRALRALRRARDEARELNYDLEDAAVAARVARFAAWYDEVQARGLTVADRKLLRGGVRGEFLAPFVKPPAKR